MASSRVVIPEARDISDPLERARILERVGRHADARATYESVLRSPPTADDTSPAALLRWVGSTHRAEGDHEAAIDCYTASLTVAELRDDPNDMAHALNWLGVVEQERGAVDVAHKLYMRAQTLAERAQDRRLCAMIEQNLGTLATIQGHLKLAVRHYRGSLRSYRTLKDHAAMGPLLNNLGVLQMELKQWEQAARCFDQAAAVCEQTRDLATRAMIEVNRTDFWYRQGKNAQALLCCNEARQLASRVEHSIVLGEAYMWYGIIYRELQNYEVAETYLDAAADVARRFQNVLLGAEIQRERALLYRAQQRNHAALQALNEAHRAFSHLHARRMLQDVDGIMRGIEDIFLDIVRRWGDSIEEKDEYTRGHCQRVADYTCMLARAVGFDEQTLVWLRMGAFLHDVGKTAIPPEILNKRGPLTPEEWKVMERHTVIGVELLSAIEFPYDIRPLVRSHHERWDGEGYPDGLSGEDIPLPARILRIADVYDALTTNRAYRKAFSRDAALAILQQEAGRIFDPLLVQTFTRLLQPLAAAEAKPRLATSA